MHFNSVSWRQVFPSLSQLTRECCLSYEAPVPPLEFCLKSHSYDGDKIPHIHDAKERQFHFGMVLEVNSCVVEVLEVEEAHCKKPAHRMTVRKQRARQEPRPRIHTLRPCFQRLACCSQAPPPNRTFSYSLLDESLMSEVSL